LGKRGDAGHRKNSDRGRKTLAPPVRLKATQLRNSVPEHSSPIIGAEGIVQSLCFILLSALWVAISGADGRCKCGTGEKHRGPSPPWRHQRPGLPRGRTTVAGPTRHWSRGPNFASWRSAAWNKASRVIGLAAVWWLGPRMQVVGLGSPGHWGRARSSHGVCSQPPCLCAKPLGAEVLEGRFPPFCAFRKAGHGE